MYDNAYTRNDDDELAVRTVSSSGDNNPNKDDVFTRDDQGRLCMRTVGGSGGGGGNVSSVNGKTGAVVLGAKDVNAIPQYSTMPIADASNVGEIAQYSGESVADSYQKGYFYANQPTYSDPSATISQTVGSGLTDLAVDLDTFVGVEQPTGADTFDFTAVFTPATTDYLVNTGSFDISGGDWSSLFSNYGMTFDDGYFSGVIYFTDSSNCYVGPSVGNVWFGTTVTDLESFGFQITGTINADDYASYLYHPSVVYWEKDSEQVSLVSYGISYSGTPVDGDTLTVAYTAPVITGYAWNQINVQPAAESTGIEWKTKVDIPAEYTGGGYITPYYTITGGLPDGTYEFYFSTKVTTDSNEVPLGEVIFKVLMSINNTNATFYGKMGYVFDGNYMNDGNAIFGSDVKQLSTLVLKNNSDMILYCPEIPWTSDIFQYITPRLVPECFKLSAIKNVDTGDEYIATGGINLDGSWPTYTTQYSGWVKLTQLVNPTFVPTPTTWTTLTAAEFATKTIYVTKRVMNGSLHLITDGSELIINFAGVGGSTLDPYLQEIVRATGIFAGCYLAYGANYIYVMGVDTTTAATLIGTVRCACGVVSNDSAGIWFDQIPTESLTVLAQFGPQAYRLGTITADGIGNIVQYTGATDSNYTNGYFYKANGTLVPTPASITFTNFNPSDVTVTVANPDALITAINNIGGWGEQWVRDALAQNQTNFNIDYDFGTGTVIKVYWSNYGDMYQQDVLDCFAVSTTGSYSDVQNISFECSNGYTPAHSDVINPSWDRVDIQPSPVKVNTTAILVAANWSSNTQTVNITGITADGVVLVSPTPANQSAYTSAGILCTAQAAGSLTFACDTVPSADITVTVVML